MNSQTPFGYPTQLSNSRGGLGRTGGRSFGKVLIAGAIVGVLILLFVLGSTGVTEEADADESGLDLAAIVGPALTRAGYGDVVVEANGRNVTLSGELPTRTDVVAASAVANSIAEVASVQNNLSHPGEAADIPIPGQTEPPPPVVEPTPPAAPTNFELELQTRLATIVALAPIAFEQRSVELTPASQGTIDQVVRLLNNNPEIRVEVGGHTDSSGVPAANEALAQNRADSVRAALIAAGIAQGRLDAVGYGDTRPIASNEFETGRALNRRIEFLIRP